MGDHDVSFVSKQTLQTYNDVSESDKTISVAGKQFVGF